MDTDTEPPGDSLVFLSFFIAITEFNLYSSWILFAILLMGSALMSGSEIAFFSLTPEQIKSLDSENSSKSRKILQLIERPKKLLATIHVGNNLINIALVLVSDIILRYNISGNIFNIWASALVEFSIFHHFEVSFVSHAISLILSVIGVTIILVLFGEIMPKIYANFNTLSLARSMSGPIKIMMTLLSGITTVLVSFSGFFEKKIEKNRKNDILSGKEELEDALDITLEEDEDQLDILKSFVYFNDVTVKQIMKPRTDVVALDSTSDFQEVLETIRESGYSRIPVYDEDFDNIRGILYAKDLLRHIEEKKGFNWLALIRDNAYYVPESKKINELLKEFQEQKIHMAIVVDEYGGSSGLVTMEDIMEEILGEILDEFDVENDESDYVKLDDNTYIFEGKTSLIDFVKVFDESISIFDDFKGDSDSLAGTILEITGEIPEQNFEIRLGKFHFIVEKVSTRRIESIKVVINGNEQ